MVLFFGAKNEIKNGQEDADQTAKIGPNDAAPKGVEDVLEPDVL